MANQVHLNILRQGVEAWNRWKREHPEIIPDLSGVIFKEILFIEDIMLKFRETARLWSSPSPWDDPNYRELVRRRQTNLNEIGLSGIDLSRVNLKGADFSGVNFVGANLSHASLVEANFVYT